MDFWKIWGIWELGIGKSAGVCSSAMTDVTHVVYTWPLVSKRTRVVLSC